MKESLLSLPLLCLCIGTDRSIADALGPLVGEILSRSNLTSILIYGTLAQPIHARNLSTQLSTIQASHPHAITLAVDASLGNRFQVGRIQLGIGPLTPGISVQNRLPPVGDYFVTGVVDIDDPPQVFTLQRTRLHHVLPMAEMIASAIRKLDAQIASLNPSRSFSESFV
jgi:putative sporulation protein YyaC